MLIETHFDYFSRAEKPFLSTESKKKLLENENVYEIEQRMKILEFNLFYPLPTVGVLKVAQHWCLYLWKYNSRGNIQSADTV